MTRALVLVALVGLSLSSLARAAPTAREIAKAKEIYNVGTTAYAAELYPDAEQAFRDVYNLIHSPNVLYNLALTLEKERKWGPAADVYEQYVREAKPSKDRQAIADRGMEMRERAQRQTESATPVPEDSPQPGSSAPGNGVMKLGAVDDTLRTMEAPEAPPPAVETANESTPVYKKWWLWVAIGGAIVVAAVITIAVVATRSGSDPDLMDTFPNFGPGASTSTLLRF